MKTKIATLFVCAVMASTALPLHAATFVVNNLGDSGPGTLRQAIVDANANVGDDTITFTVNGTITLAANLPVITSPLSIVGPGTNSLTISGAGTYSAFAMNGGFTNSISDLRIANMYARGTGIPVEPGPFYTNACGVNSDGPITLTRCIFTECRTTYSRGGAIFTATELNMQGCRIENCGAPGSAPSVGGGAIYNNGGTVRLKDCSIYHCVGAGSSQAGGGIWGVGANNIIDLINTRIEACSTGYSTDGGGILSDGTIVLNDCVISNNTAVYWGAGIASTGTLLMTNSIVSGNAGNAGGGLANFGTAVLVGCTLSSNGCWGAPGGGAILNTGNMKLYNCTVSQNSVFGSSLGGPLAANISDKLNSSLGTTYLNHCTIVLGNGSAENIIQGTFTSANSIIGNIKGTMISEGYNLIVSTTNTTVTGNATGNIYNVNPNLGPLQNNGGPTFTHSLLSGSPAIDNGTTGGLSNDQRGASRQSAADIGAFEVVTVMPPDLQIALTDPSHVLLSWPSAPGPVVLQQKGDLANGLWSDVIGNPLNNGTTTSIILSTDSNGKSYRLRSP